MQQLTDKRVIVIGLGASGQAACRLLRQRGARVWAVDSADSPGLRADGEDLRARGVAIALGAESLPGESFDFAVASPGVPAESALLRAARERRIDVIGELELGYQQALCLSVAITGTNGKTTTTEMVTQMLDHAGRKTMAAGNIGVPLCSVVEQTKDLDLIAVEVSSFQLETIQYFRPAIAVLLNITPDHLDRYASMSDYIRAKAQVFRNQQAFDWAIIQSEALAQIRSMDLPVPSKVITFSANNRRADIYLDRGLLLSRVPDWAGRLLDMDTCRVRGPHNAENLMAVLAVGRVLRLPLEQMAEALREYRPAMHRCERVAELNGVQYINDSKATNLDALEKAILSIPACPGDEPNIVLIAGGKDKGLSFHEIGPLLARRVKQAFLLGETREKLRAAWSLFTPCAFVDSLLEAVAKASENVVSGDVVLLSPACSSFDMFQNYQHRGEVFRQAVRKLGQTTGCGAGAGNTSASSGSLPPEISLIQLQPPKNELAPSFLREKHRGHPSHPA